MPYITLPVKSGIKNVQDPVALDEVTTKGYVDARISTVSNTAPTSSVSGALWVDTSISPYVLKVYFNNLWVTISGGTSEVITDGYTYAGNIFTFLGDYYSQPV